MQLYSLTIFRAVAIVLVVFSHAEMLGALEIDTPAEALFSNIIAGATTLFVFISGFLFHHVFAKKFGTENFLRKKLINLGIPYLILSCVAFALGCAWDTTGQADGWLGQVQLAGFMLGTGSAAQSYWYIPFILTMFAMAPLHMRFASLSLRWQVALIAVLLTAALFAHRPPANIGALQNIAYYTPVYLLGMFCSQHRDRVYPVLEKLTWPLLAAVVGLAVLEIATGRFSNYAKPMFEFDGVDLMLVQKLCLGLFLLAFLRRFETRRSRAVEMVADTSFAIFFLHPIFIQLFATNPLVKPLLAQENWPLYFIGSILCLGACVALAILLQRGLGRRSRYLTGY